MYILGFVAAALLGRQAFAMPKDSALNTVTLVPMNDITSTTTVTVTCTPKATTKFSTVLVTTTINDVTSPTLTHSLVSTAGSDLKVPPTTTLAKTPTTTLAKTPTTLSVEISNTHCDGPHTQYVVSLDQKTATTQTPTSTATTPTDSDPPGSSFDNMVYLSNWGIYDSSRPNDPEAIRYSPRDLPVDSLTHVLYAFANITKEGKVGSSDNWSDFQKPLGESGSDESGRNARGGVEQLYLLKQKNRNLKTLLSIGGWSYSVDRQFAAVSNAEGRETFCSSAVKLLEDWGLDGLDIDWEFPANEEEGKAFLELLKKCRSALDKHAKGQKGQEDYHFLLTVAAPVGQKNYQFWDLGEMDKYIDTWHLMAYDYATSEDSTTGHQANVYGDASTKFDTDTAVKHYIGAGIDSKKIILGMPLYGRSFANTDGQLGSNFDGTAGGREEDKLWFYKDLPRKGAEEMFDDKLIAAWSYDSQTRELVTYDNEQSAKAKVQYLKDNNLGGAFFWDASMDKEGDKGLMKYVADALGELDSSENCREYPDSQYDNIRTGTS